VLASRPMKASRFALAAFAALSLQVSSAIAFPGFYAGKNTAKRAAHATHMVIMLKGEASAVTVMPDYEGPLEPFAMVLVVPGDVTAERVTPLKREFVDRVEKITAPRFHEFWELDPCEPGSAEQEWERSMSARGDTAFLGGSGPQFGQKKVAKELFLNVETSFKESSEYTITVLGAEENLGDVLRQKGYVPPSGALEAVAPYRSQGWTFLIAEVDSNRIELVGGDRAILSPIRFWSEKPFTKIPARVGLKNAPDKPELFKQELFVYVFHPDKRYATKNYPNVFPPTNIEVDFIVKERVGEFYAGIHDMMLATQPHAFLSEYAWQTQGCGQRCATEPPLINEILSMGGDAFEQFVPDEEKNPEPPELTEEQKKEFKATLDGVEPKLTPKERRDREKQFEEERKLVEARKALVARHHYVLSRVHHRYDEKGLPRDPEIGPAPHVKGGVDIPKGKEGELPTKVEPAARSQHQTRYVFFHPWISVIKCDRPERYRWGKSPRTYRGLRKIWLAEDMTRRNRKQIVPAAVVIDPIPSLGLRGKAALPGDGGADAGEGAENAKGRCGCSTPGERSSSSPLAAALLALACVRRRRGRDER
jgi:hypothetical protein